MSGRLLEIQKELPARHDPDSVHEEPFLPPVEQQPLRLRVILPKSFQPTKIRRMDGSRVLHLDRTEEILPVEDEIDFMAGAGPPVIQAAVRPLVIDPGQKVLRHQTLQSRSADFLRTVERTFGAQRVVEPRVEKIEFRMGNGRSLRLAGEHRYPERQQQVFEYRKIPLDRFSLDAALARDVGNGQLGTVRETGRFEETGEVPDIPGQPLGLDLFPEVKVDVGMESRFRVRAPDDDRYHPVAQGARKGERLPQLPGDERVHPLEKGAPRQHVGAVPFELSRAGPRQDEASPPVLLHQGMDDVEKLGDFLDLVQDDYRGAGIAVDHLPEPFGMREERAKDVRLEQGDVERVREVRPDEGGFPRTPRPEEEETLRFDPEKSSDRFHLEPQYGSIGSKL